MDSLPSADAIAVLAGIPEALGPGEIVPPPAIAGAGSAATRAPVDSLAAALADSAGAASDTIPVPVETAPLGDAPGTLARPAVPDTPPPPPIAPPPVAAPPKPAGPDTCWRVQFAAPDQSAEAELRRAAAQSLLMIPVVIELKGGLFKVRTSDCLSEDAADRLRARARSSGFADAFRFREIRR
ncbi:MAG TPA: SPOR domain-containing protein [Anaeromyxobacter sp.]